MKAVKIKYRKMFFPVLLLIFTLAAAGCARFDPAQYVMSTLDFNFKGEVEQYAKIVDKSADTLQKEYDQMMEWTDLENFKTFFDIDSTSDETNALVISFYKELFAKADYKASGTEKTEDSYEVTVKVAPLDIFYQSYEDINAFVAEFNENNKNFVYADLADYEYEDVYARGVLDVLKNHLDSVGYLKERTFTVRIQKDHNSYSINAEDFDAVCEAVVAYEVPDE